MVQSRVEEVNFTSCNVYNILVLCASPMVFNLEHVVILLILYTCHKYLLSCHLRFWFEINNRHWYSSGGGSAQKTVIRDFRLVYQKMLRDSREHQLEGFGPWEFLTLLGNSPRRGRTRCAHHLYGRLGFWRPNQRASRASERRRAPKKNMANTQAGPHRLPHHLLIVWHHN